MDVSSQPAQVFDQALLIDFCKHVRENLIDISKHGCRLKALNLLHSARLHDGDFTVSLGAGMVDRLGAFLKSPDSAVTPGRVYGFVSVLREVQECVFRRSPFDNGPASGFVEDSFESGKGYQKGSGRR